MRNFPVIFVLSLLLTAMAAGAAASPRLGLQAAGDGDSDVPLSGAARQDAPQKSELLQLAAELGRASGDAEFCEYDPRVVERFIVNAQARLARETADGLRMAGARLEFNAFAAYGRSRGPDDGCEAFEAQFADLRRFVQR